MKKEKEQRKKTTQVPLQDVQPPRIIIGCYSGGAAVGAAIVDPDAAEHLSSFLTRSWNQSA